MRILEDDWRGSPAGADRPPWTGITTFFAGGREGPDTSGVLELDPMVGAETPTDEPDPPGPWKGALPPKYMKGMEGKFQRRSDGVWCLPDATGRLYAVDSMGERWTARRAKAQTDLSRPVDIPTEVWISYTAAEKR